jgi:hypothetical protein
VLVPGSGAVELPETPVLRFGSIVLGVVIEFGAGSELEGDAPSVGEVPSAPEAPTPAEVPVVLPPTLDPAPAPAPAAPLCAKAAPARLIAAIEIVAKRSFLMIILPNKWLLDRGPGLVRSKA